MATTIQVSDEVKAALDKMRIFDKETYNEIIGNMLEDNLELNEKTKRELGERRKNRKFISHEEVEKRLGL